MKKSEESLRDLWDTINKITICIIGVPEVEKRERERERNLIQINNS